MEAFLFFFFQFDSRLMSQIQAKDNDHGSKAFTVDDLYKSVELQSTEAILCTVCNKETKDVRVDCPASLSAMRAKHRASKKWQESKRKKTAQSVPELHLGFQEGLPFAVFGKPVKDEEQNSELNLLDLRTDSPDKGKGQIYFPKSLLLECSEGGLVCSQPGNQIDPVEHLIRQLKSELVFLRSEVRHLNRSA